MIHRWECPTDRECGRGYRLRLVLLWELAGWIRSEESRLVTISEASDMGGYSEEHLRRLVRSGDLPAVQDCPGGRIRLRARDVPIKPAVSVQQPDISPARVASGTSDAYDPAADARDIAQAIGG